MMKFKKKSILKKIPKMKKNRNQKNKDQIKKKTKTKWQDNFNFCRATQILRIWERKERGEWRKIKGDDTHHQTSHALHYREDLVVLLPTQSL